MRTAILLFALLLLVGCSRSASPAKPTGPSASGILPATNQSPPASLAAATRPSIESQPIRTPTFEKKFDWKLQAGELKTLETSRPTKHNLILTMKATPAGSRVGIAVVVKMDLDAAVEAYKIGHEPKNTLAHHAGGDNLELNAAMPAVLPYAIILRNYGEDPVTVELLMKAQ